MDKVSFKYFIMLHGMPVEFKQWGTWGADEVKRSKKKNGRMFLKKEWNEYPNIKSKNISPRRAQRYTKKKTK